MTRIRVLSPVGTAKHASTAAPPLPADLAGRAVGFIDNNKANFDRLVDDIGPLLRVPYCVRRGVPPNKADSPTPAPPPPLPDLATGRRIVVPASSYCRP